MDKQIETFRLIACPTLSHENRIDKYLSPGQTMQQYLREIGWREDKVEARVFIDGQLIPDAEWEMAEPKAGQAVVVRRIFTGGGQGGNQGKQIGMIVGMLALMVATWWIGGGGLAGFLPTALQMVGQPLHTALSAIVLVGGSLAMNALIQPNRPRLGNLSNLGEGSRALSLTGAQNEMAPYARIPRVYGTHRMFPPLAARPYTEIVGNQQYLRLLFCFGYGPLHVAASSIKIGETPLSQYTDWEDQLLPGYDTDPPLTLVPDDIIEESASRPLTAAVSWVTLVTATNGKEISIDVSFPNGVVRYDGSGRATTWSVSFDLEYRKISGTPDPTFTLVAGAPAIAATITTNFTGANNDLLFTRLVAGVRGNSRSVYFKAGTSLKVDFGVITIYNQGGSGTLLNTDSVEITIVQGVTTAAQVIAAWNAKPALVAWASIANAPGNDGTGAITLPVTTVWSYNQGNYQSMFQNFQFSGGRDVIPAFTVTGNTRSLVRKSVRWVAHTAGQQYEVRIRRTTPDTHPNGDQLVDQAYWTMLRTIQSTSPVLKKGLCLYALRIKATDQLNGTLDTLNAVVTSILPDWNGATWEMRATDNPASIYRDVLQGRANRRPKTDAQLDLATIQAFHGRCIANGYTFNAVIDFQTTVKQLRQDVLASARATFGLRDMKYSVVEDLLQATPVDIISPRTTSGFKWVRRFLKMPHALKVRFIDRTNNYKQGELPVFVDGYNAANAVDYEETDAGIGVTDPTQVWKLKKRELRDAVLRADDYEVTMDFANLNFTRGDRVQLQHDVILAGLVSARVKTVTLNGSLQATAITFDEPFTMALGVDYGMRLRKASGVQVLQQVVTIVGEVVGVTFSTPIPVGSVPDVGDLVTFGTLGNETIDCIVKGVEPGPDFSAVVRLQDYAPAIHDADSEIPPIYDSLISLPAPVVPPLPTVIQVLSDESVLVRDLDGALQSRILVSVHFPSGLRFMVTRIETQFKITDSDDEWVSIFTDVTGQSVEVPIRPVQDGETYDIRLRTVKADDNQTSEWAFIDGHVVIGKTSPPPDVTGVILEGSRLRWSYDDPPEDLAGFLVRYRSGTSSDWETALPLHTQVILTTDLIVPVLTSVTTFLVKAVDVAGNQSANPATIIINFTDQLVGNVVREVDLDALNFPGTITNGTITGGNLVANGASAPGDPFWSGDTNVVYASGGGAPFWAASFSELRYEFTYTVPSDLLDAVLKIQTTALGDWRLEYRLDSNAVMWNAVPTTLMWNAVSTTVMWSPKGAWSPWPGQLSPLQPRAYDFRFVGTAGVVQAVIDELSLIFDVVDVTESFADLIIAAGGTRLPLTKPYRQILVVNVTLNDTGGTAVYTLTIDKNVFLGPLIRAFNAANVSVGASVDVIVQGY